MRNLLRGARAETAGPPAQLQGESHRDAPPAARPSSTKDFESLLPTAQFEQAVTRYRSHFEGLWTDRVDALEVVERRARAGQISEHEEDLLRAWIERGYVVLPGAVPADVCEQVKADLAAAFTNGDERLSVLAPGEHFGQPLEPGTDMRGRRVNDIYVYFESARQALFAEALTRFLGLIFDGAPLLLQSLTFESGSRQGSHQDTAYVVIDPPLALAASWIALEDVRPGSGELVYYEGSHRLPDFLFSGSYKCWHPERDGADQHTEFAEGLSHRAESAGMELKRLLVKEGDALIWSGDLVHGGGEVTDERLTRRSLVGHYCPEWAVPRYFDQFPERSARRWYRDGLYASTHYSLD